MSDLKINTVDRIVDAILDKWSVGTVYTHSGGIIDDFEDAERTDIKKAIVAAVDSSLFQVAMDKMLEGNKELWAEKEKGKKL